MIQQLRFSPRRQVACGMMAAIFCALPLVSDVKAIDPIATFNTSAGSFQVELFPAQAPNTVANFLGYVDSGEYNNMMIQRIVAGFIAQTGGYTTDGAPFLPSSPPSHISTVPTDGGQGYQLPNEFGLSNVAGTLAMAKMAGDPNSATSEFFFNLADNSSNLDNQNGGFTVFGQVIGDGMSVLSELAAAPNFDLSSAWGAAFQNVPLTNWDIDTASEVDATNFETITSITVPRVTGDVNLDGIVNGQDIAVAASNWGKTAGFVVGDTNGDHTVGALDITTISNNWLQTLSGQVNNAVGGIIASGSISFDNSSSSGAPGTAGDSQVMAVPEPSSILLAALAAGWVAFAGRRKRAPR